jgi:hypothetical protein
VPVIFAQLRGDGKYHYVSSVLHPDEEPGPTYEVAVTGQGELPAGCGLAASPADHDAWLADLRRRGFTVEVRQVDSAPVRPGGGQQR